MELNVIVRSIMKARLYLMNRIVKSIHITANEALKKANLGFKAGCLHESKNVINNSALYGAIYNQRDTGMYDSKP
jgi:hypothetical protein